jgi:uncharacterized phage protein (TIGR02220 family)
MPEKQRAPFLYALAEYRFEKKEPKGSPPWLPTFIALKQRIDLGDEASERGRKMAQARWGKQKAQASPQQDADASAKHDAQANAAAHAQAYAQASNSSDAEDEVEIEVEIPPYSPPMPSSVQDAPFWLQCLAAFNDQLGTTYTTMPEKCRHMLDRCAEGYTVEEVRKMLAYKHEEWKGTRWRNCLTPNFLFSPDHFEQCMHQSKGEDEEVADYAKYDA